MKEVKKGIVRELKNRGYEEAQEMVNNYFDYYYTDSKTLVEVIDEVTEMEKCSMCGEWYMQDDMVDTEGMINGGIGNVCLDCKGDF